MADNTPILNQAGLNFFDIKYNFINYLKNQSQFSDYNFEASNISVILDILAYNTSQQGFYNTMVANEMFLDRAVKRSSIVSLAKMLGYTPSTKKAAKAKILVTVAAEDLPASGVISRGTVFTGSIDNTNYTFTNTESYPFYPYEFEDLTDPDSGDHGAITTYACGPMELKQGYLNTISYNVQSYDESFLITDSNADKDTIRVFVVNSMTDTTGINIPWFSSSDITTIDEDSKVFFIEENDFGQLMLKFGDGVLGKKLSVGNIVIIEYLSTAGAAGNNIGATDTTIRTSFTNENSDFTIYTLEPSNSGFDRETSSSIRRNAVRSYASKDRAVTKSDYEGLVLAAFNNNAAVRCWGGEENDPPVYGKVFLSVRPIGTTILTDEEKTNIITNVLEQKNIVGMDVTIVDPEVLYVNLNLGVFYNKDSTSESATSIAKKIRTSLISYFRNNLVEFGDSVFAQDIETQVKNSSVAIKAADAEITLMRKIQPTLTVAERTTVDFQNKLYHPYAGYQSIITTNTFYIAQNSGIHYIEDDGNGNLVLKKKINGIVSTVNATYGTIDYTTGKLVIPALKVYSYSQGQTSIRFKAIPETNNIFTTKNSILEFDYLDNEALDITMKEVKTQQVTGGSGTVITNL